MTNERSVSPNPSNMSEGVLLDDVEGVSSVSECQWEMPDPDDLNTLVLTYLMDSTSVNEKDEPGPDETCAETSGTVDDDGTSAKDVSALKQQYPWVEASGHVMTNKEMVDSDLDTDDTCDSGPDERRKKREGRETTAPKICESTVEPAWRTIEHLTAQAERRRKILDDLLKHRDEQKKTVKRLNNRLHKQETAHNSHVAETAAAIARKDEIEETVRRQASDIFVILQQKVHRREARINELQTSRRDAEIMHHIRRVELAAKLEEKDETMERLHRECAIDRTNCQQAVLVEQANIGELERFILEQGEKIAVLEESVEKLLTKKEALERERDGFMVYDGARQGRTAQLTKQLEEAKAATAEEMKKSWAVKVELETAKSEFLAEKSNWECDIAGLKQLEVAIAMEVRRSRTVREQLDRVRAELIRVTEDATPRFRDQLDVAQADVAKERSEHAATKAELDKVRAELTEEKSRSSCQRIWAQVAGAIPNDFKIRDYVTPNMLMSGSLTLMVTVTLVSFIGLCLPHSSALAKAIRGTESWWIGCIVLNKVIVLAMVYISMCPDDLSGPMSLEQLGSEHRAAMERNSIAMERTCKKIDELKARMGLNPLVEAKNDDDDSSSDDEEDGEGNVEGEYKEGADDDTDVSDKNGKWEDFKENQSGKAVVWEVDSETTRAGFVTSQERTGSESDDDLWGQSILSNFPGGFCMSKSAALNATQLPDLSESVS